MGIYSYGKGRKKAVQRFTNCQGLMILGMAGGILAGLLGLWILGVLRFEGH
jgi:hypothetical protein